MKLKTIIIETIKVAKTIYDVIFGRKDHLREYRLSIIEIVNKIKDAVNSDTATLIVAIIPGHTDDKILQCIREWLPTILRAAGLTNNVFSTNMALQDSIKTLKEVNSNDRAGYYKRISGELYTNFSGLPFEMANDQIQEEYKRLKE